ncbi:MAG TPA: sigma-70 family RNA polymerase sigma factor [Candidatus Dormibacteraeota bacterium]|nr:sigma-70 family RNA polymerase sigma factor [Candidatus Dormibacteraeota bacterium]
MKDDDRAWFEPLVRNLSHPALKYAQMLVLNTDVAQEIVQEAFARVWASAKTPSREDEFRRWLYRIIANLANDYHRRQAISGRASLPHASLVDPVEEVEQRDQRKLLLAAMKRLTPKARQAVYLRYFEDRSFAETAGVMGLPQVTVRVIVHRALATLRQRLASRRVDEVAV